MVQDMASFGGRFGENDWKNRDITLPQHLDLFAA
jgi:hypothetical protein